MGNAKFFPTIFLWQIETLHVHLHVGRCENFVKIAILYKLCGPVVTIIPPTPNMMTMHINSNMRVPLAYALVYAQNIKNRLQGSKSPCRPIRYCFKLTSVILKQQVKANHIRTHLKNVPKEARNQILLKDSYG